MSEHPDKERLIHILLREDLSQEEPPDVCDRVLKRIKKPRENRGSRSIAARREYSRRTTRMRFRRRAAFAAAALLMISAGLFHFMNSEDPPNQETYPKIIETATANALIRDGKRRTPTRGMMLKANDILETAQDARLLIGYSSERTTIRLYEQSRLKIMRCTQGRQFRLTRGRIEGTAAPQPLNRPMVVSTPIASATVVGTHFFMASYPERSRVDVVSGKVRMTHTASGHSALVTEGLTGSINGIRPLVLLFRECPVTDGLVAHLPFDHSGNTAGDLSDKANHGRIFGNSPTRLSGARDGALNLDGEGNWMLLKNKDVARGAPFSICFWFDINNAPRFPKRTILSLIDTAGKTICRIAMDQDPARDITDVNVTVLKIKDRKHRRLVFGRRSYPYAHLCLAYDGRKITMYQNGKRADAFTPRDAIAFDRCLFGKIHDGKEFFCGGFDEFRLYNRALSPAEITTVYESDLPISN